MNALSITPWYIGYGFWLTMLLVIIGALAAILHLARTIGDQSREIAVVLNVCRRHTVAIGRVREINEMTNEVAQTFGQVRADLGGKPMGDR